MTLAEFFGCTFLAFGPPFAMFVFTIAHDPIRIIILIAAAFFWLLSLLISSILWFAVVPLRDFLAFGLVFSILFQEAFRYVIYVILRKTERGLQEVTENSRVTENKHILAYVSGLGFGIISGAFALVNVLADSVGPATMGLQSGTNIFFITSAAHTLCTVLLHTFWSVIFFNALDTSKYAHAALVVISHLFVSCLTLLNKQELYYTTLIPRFIVTILMGILALKVVGGSLITNVNGFSMGTICLLECLLLSNAVFVDMLTRLNMSNPPAVLNPINLTYLNGVSFSFNADDYMRIRTEHRIVGSLVGTCNVRGRCSSENSLPAEFNGIETQLLIEKGFARLLSKKCIHNAPNAESIEDYNRFVRRRVDEQKNILKAEKLKESKKNINKILDGKCNRIYETTKTEQDINLNSEELLKEISDSIVSDEKNTLHDIPFEHPFDHETETVQLPIDITPKYRVFKDLWERGKFVTSGELFGADFITYPGDPMIFHASHIVIVMNDTNVNKLELISKGRLSVIVNKICVFAYINSAGSEVLYQTLHWDGCKNNFNTIK